MVSINIEGSTRALHVDEQSQLIKLLGELDKTYTTDGKRVYYMVGSYLNVVKDGSGDDFYLAAKKKDEDV